MTLIYSLTELFFYLLLYSFFGWAAELLFGAIMHRSFINSGFLNLPFALPYGMAAAVLLVALPTLQHNLILQYVMIFVVLSLVWNLSGHFVRNVSHKNVFAHRHRTLFHDIRSTESTMALAAVYLVLYLVVHPIVFSLVALIPKLLLTVLVWVWVGLVAVDFITVLYTLKTNNRSEYGEERKHRTLQLADKMVNAIWRRLQKAYPGIREPEDITPERFVFAQGICLDKLMWVFLVSSFLGALIEMVYCRLMGDIWMNRSSLLYGTFSVVWGFGAVVLTVALQRLAGKRSIQIFFGGFFIGGTYEYLCSVLTELIFGTVFWDYSSMPLNIGGRTNVPFCVCWGLLAVLWLKIFYPRMSRMIEKIPPLPGKMITWALILVLACDGLLTMGAMIRYDDRQAYPEPRNVIEAFLDENYDDGWMEHRWPNMKRAA